MRHSIIYGVLILAVVLTGSMPFHSADVGKLRPVRTLYAQSLGEQVQITADTGDMGQGDCWRSAVQNLEDTASGRVLAGAVSYILMNDDSLLPQILEQKELNPSCALCIAAPGVDLEAAGAYLDAHEPDSSLRLLRAEASAIPWLEWSEGRFYLHGAEN